MGSAQSRVFDECKRVSEGSESFCLQSFSGSTSKDVQAVERVLSSSSSGSLSLSNSNGNGNSSFSSVLLKSIEASNGDLSRFPSLWKCCPSTLTRVSLDGNALHTIPADMRGCVALKELSLCNNHFRSVPMVLFDLPALTTLALRGNMIAELPSLLPSECALTAIDLESNFLKDFVALTQLTRLEALKLGNNSGISEIPETITRLTALQTLHLQNCFLRDISPLSTLTRLRYLHLNNNQISEVPLSDLAELRVLALQHNVVTELPEDIFAKMSNLQTLALNDNMLLRIPSSVGALVSLNRMFLHENLLATLPPEIGKCIELTQLRLEYNELRTLPEDIGKLVFLLVLIAHNNKLTATPEFLFHMPQLLRLSIAFNPIVTKQEPNSSSGNHSATGTAKQHQRLGMSLESALESITAVTPSSPLLSLSTLRGSHSASPQEFTDFKPSEDFNRAFEHFVDTRDLSRSKKANFLNGPAQAKLLLMRQHRDAILRLYLSGRADDGGCDNAGAISVHRSDPMVLVQQLKGSPTKLQLEHLNAGLQEFQDAWFGLFIEYGGVEELLKLLHRLYLQRGSEYAESVLCAALNIFRTIFDAVWKTVLVTHSSIPVLLLHLDSGNVKAAKIVLQIVHEIACIDEVGVTILLKGFTIRKRMIGSEGPRLLPLYTLVVSDSEGAPEIRAEVMRLVNAILDHTPFFDRKATRLEFLSLHPVSAKAFLNLLDAYGAVESSGLSVEIDRFIDMLREEAAKISLVETGDDASGGQGRGSSSDLAADIAGSTAGGKKRGPPPVLNATARDGKEGAASSSASGSDAAEAAANAARYKLKMKLREFAFDVTSCAPLPKLRLRQTMLPLTERLGKVVRSLVEQFSVDPAHDYQMFMYTGEPSRATQLWLNEDRTLAEFNEVRIDEPVTALFFSIKPVPMTYRLPSGETRTIPTILLSLVQDVLVEVKAQLSDHLPDGPITLAIDNGSHILAADAPLSKQGVEPYTVLFVLTEAERDSTGAPLASGAGGGTTRGGSGGIGGAGGVADGPEPPSDEPLGNVWDEPFTPKYIVLENGEVTSATINKIVERMTSIDTIDLQLTQTFFWTYKSFTTPEEVWKKLLERYECPSRVADTDVQKIRMRVCLFLKRWMEGRRAGDFSPQLLMTLMDFVENRLAKDGLTEMQAALMRLMSGSVGEKVITYDRRQAPKAKHPKVKAVEKMTVLDIDSVELARQITIKTWSMFSLLQPIEFFNQAWMRKDSATQAANILHFIGLFNKMCAGIATTILTEPRVRKRAILMEKFIDVAVELRALNNFHMVMSFISAFAQASINRLKFTFEKISDAHQAKLKGLQDLMNPEKSFSLYRAAYNQDGGIPYLGAYLTDLTFIEEATLSKIGVRINLQKHTMIYGVLEKLALFKKKIPLNLEPVDSIQAWIDGLPSMSEKELYDASLAVEPRGADGVK